MLFVVSAVRAIGEGVQMPSVGAFLPAIVPMDKLTRVNGINSSIQSLVTLVSPMLSGVMLTVAAIEAVFFVDVVTAAVAVSIMILFLHVPAHGKALQDQKLNYLGDMYEGIKYIKNHNFIKTLFIFCAVYFILIAPLAFLTPLQVARSFGNDVWRLTIIEVVYALGMMLGGLIMASWGGLKNKLHTMVLSTFVIAVSTFALGLIHVFWIYTFMMGIIGLVLPVFNTPFTVLLQQKVEADFLGRVFGVLTMISSSIMPLAMIGYGPAADFIKIEWLLLVTGLLMLVQSFVMLKNKVLFEAGKPMEE
jgi:DHA3 family macrolide efflux protein-like MFS transporter